MSRRPHIQQRRRFYVGCEGQSEGGYVAQLQHLCDAEGLHLHLDIDTFPAGVGDPLDRVSAALRRSALRARLRGAYRARFIFLDSDQAIAHPQRAADARRAAERTGLVLIWQETCHESLLLRHLDGHQARRPVDTASAVRSLIQAWPNYAKPMDAHALSLRINRDAVLRASAAEPELANFLRVLGWNV